MKIKIYRSASSFSSRLSYCFFLHVVTESCFTRWMSPNFYYTLTGFVLMFTNADQLSGNEVLPLHVFPFLLIKLRTNTIQATGDGFVCSSTASLCSDYSLQYWEPVIICGCSVFTAAGFIMLACQHALRALLSLAFVADTQDELHRFLLTRPVLVFLVDMYTVSAAN